MNANKWALYSMISLFKKADLQNEITEETSNSSADEHLNPELQKYFWIAEALSALFNKPIDSEFNKEFTLFVLQNKSKIDKAISMGSFQEFLGKGKDGVASLLGGNFVFKIFLNDGAYQAAKSAMDRLYNDPASAKTEAMMYDVGTLGSFLNQTIYYYVQEQMAPITQQSKDVSDNLAVIVKTVIKDIQIEKKKWDLLKKYFNDTTKADRVKSLIAGEVSKTVSMLQRVCKKNIEFFDQDANLQLKKSWLSSLVEEVFMKYLTNRTDIHFGNIGVTNFGEFRYFDPAHSKSKNRFLTPVTNKDNAEDETAIVETDQDI